LIIVVVNRLNCTIMKHICNAIGYTTKSTSTLETTTQKMTTKRFKSIKPKSKFYNILNLSILKLIFIT
jgi:hypothetical protein